MDHIEKKIKSHPVTLFMKGTPEAPMCGFSRVVVKILELHGVSFTSFDVMEDSQLRSDLKVFSQWPTFPQLYVQGELIGGCDIVREMHESGELDNLLSSYKSN